MLDIKVTRTIHAPIDEVWRVVIHDFTNAYRWAFGTSSCRAGTDSEPFDRICDTETELRLGPRIETVPVSCSTTSPRSSRPGSRRTASSANSSR